MLYLVAAAIVGGCATAAVLAPINLLTALIVAPVGASIATILACFPIAWLTARKRSRAVALDAQTDAMAAALRDVALQAKAASSTPEASADHHRAA